MKKTSYIVLIICTSGIPMVTVGLAQTTERGQSLTLSAMQVLRTTLRLDTKRPIVESGQKLFANAKYVGSEVCADCHTNVDLQDTSLHHKMKRRASLDVVKCKFDGRPVTYKVKGLSGAPEEISYTVIPHENGGKYFFTVKHGVDETKDLTHEIVYATGGALHDQAFEVKITDPRVTKDGLYEMTFPSPLRCELATGDWTQGGQTPQYWVKWHEGAVTPRREHELDKTQFAQGQCHGCHTTGNTFREVDGLIRGTRERGVVELGVRCETCHGPGSQHIAQVAELQKKGVKDMRGLTAIVHGVTDLTAEQQMNLCGQCHMRPVSLENKSLGFPLNYLPGDRDLLTKVRKAEPKSSNFAEAKYFRMFDGSAINGNTQFNEMFKSAHANAGVTCLTCHSPHSSGLTNQMRETPYQTCVSCHGNGSKGDQVAMYNGSPMQKANVTCADCHNALRGFRTVAPKHKKPLWQVTSHSFKIAPPSTELDPGNRSSCTTCHMNDTRGGASPSHLKEKPEQYELVKFIEQYDTRMKQVKNTINVIRITLRGVDVKNPAAKKLADQAITKLSSVEKDGSFGVHNFKKTNMLLLDAQKIANQAKIASGAIAQATLSQGKQSKSTTTSPSNQAPFFGSSIELSPSWRPW